MPSAPPDAAVERFRTDLTALTGPDVGRLGLAVSGGPDSLALLLLSHAAGFECTAATVDHNLRVEGADEARFVEGVCYDLTVPHTTLQLGTLGKGNLSDRARDARYAALTEWGEANGIAFLVTAHHADDQLETMLMRLNRSAGVGGLAGIRARRGQIVRPLLTWRKAELEELVQSCGVTARKDPSNQDDHFDRARLRKSLQGASWLNPVAASRSAAALSEAEDALDWTAKAYENQRVGENDKALSFDPNDLPPELVRRIILACLRRIVPTTAPRGDALDRLMIALANGQTTTLSGVKCTGGPIWRFTPAPPRRTV